MDQQTKYMAPVQAQASIRAWGMVQVPGTQDVWEAKNRGGYDIRAKVIPISPTEVKMILTKTKCIC